MRLMLRTTSLIQNDVTIWKYAECVKTVEVFSSIKLIKRFLNCWNCKIYSITVKILNCLNVFLRFFFKKKEIEKLYRLSRKLHRVLYSK